MSDLDLHAELVKHAIAGVVIGGSAGALDGLLHILPALPASFPVPVLVVVHLPPTQPSALPAVLLGRGAPPAREAVDKMMAEPGTIVIAPPDYHMLVETDGTISLSVEPPVHYSRPSIDVLFESARWAWGARTLAILLSGASEDGAAGLSAICAAGGLGWVQSPDTATASLMPAAALRQAPGARALAIGEMVDALRGRAA